MDTRKLDSIQRKGIRRILGEKWDCSSAAMRSRLGWMTPAREKTKNDEGDSVEEMFKRRMPNLS